MCGRLRVGESFFHVLQHYAEVRIMPRRRAAFGQMHSISATYRHNQSGGTWLLSGSEALPAACSATSISAIKVSI